MIEEYPIPFDRDRIIQIQKDVEGTVYDVVGEEGIIENVDEFHEKYIDELSRTDEWSVFKCHWVSGWGWYYFWNHQLGYGFKVDSDWETMCAFVDMMDEFTEEYSSEDFEPAYYSWQLP